MAGNLKLDYVFVKLKRKKVLSINNNWALYSSTLRWNPIMFLHFKLNKEKMRTFVRVGAIIQRWKKPQIVARQAWGISSRFVGQSERVRATFSPLILCLANKNSTLQSEFVDMGIPALLFLLSSTDCFCNQIPTRHWHVVATAINWENVYKLLGQQ